MDINYYKWGIKNNRFIYIHFIKNNKLYLSDIEYSDFKLINVNENDDFSKVFVKQYTDFIKKKTKEELNDTLKISFILLYIRVHYVFIDFWCFYEREEKLSSDKENDATNHGVLHRREATLPLPNTKMMEFSCHNLENYA